MKKDYNGKNEKELMIEILSRLDDIKDLQKEANRKAYSTFGFIDSVELSSLLHISRSTITRWVKNGILRVGKVGHKLFFKLSDVSVMMQEHFQRH